MHQRDVWYNRLLGLRTRTDRRKGYEAYCEGKIFQWEEFARIADFQFRSSNPDFPVIWSPLVTPV
jgi:hypothetical protein